MTEDQIKKEIARCVSQHIIRAIGQLNMSTVKTLITDQFCKNVNVWEKCTDCADDIMEIIEKNER